MQLCITTQQQNNNNNTEHQNPPRFERKAAALAFRAIIVNRYHHISFPGLLPYTESER